MSRDRELRYGVRGKSLSNIQLEKLDDISTRLLFFTFFQSKVSHRLHTATHFSKNTKTITLRRRSENKQTIHPLAVFVRMDSITVLLLYYIMLMFC